MATGKVLPDLQAQKAAAIARATEQKAAGERMQAENPVLDCYMAERGPRKGKLVWLLKFGYKRQMDTGMLRWCVENPKAAKAFLDELDKSNNT